MGAHRDSDEDTVAIAAVVDDRPEPDDQQVSRGRGARFRGMIRRAAVLVLGLFALLVVATLINEVHYTRELLQAQIEADAQDARERGNLLDQVEEQNRRITLLSEQLEAAGLVPAGSLAIAEAPVDDEEPASSSTPPAGTSSPAGPSTGSVPAGSSSQPSASSGRPGATAAAPSTGAPSPAPAPAPAPAPVPPAPVPVPAPATDPPCLLGLPGLGCVIGLPDLGLAAVIPPLLAPPVAGDRPRDRRSRPWT